jgi:hypothetical protein
MTNDAEKRRHDPGSLRAAVVYVVIVVVVAAAAFVAYAAHNRNAVMWALSTPTVLFVGTLGAFLKTFRDWRTRRTWPVWQGAGWLLLTLTVVSMAVPAMGLSS